MMKKHRLQNIADITESIKRARRAEEVRQKQEIERLKKELQKAKSIIKGPCNVKDMENDDD